MIPQRHWAFCLTIEFGILWSPANFRLERVSSQRSLVLLSFLSLDQWFLQSFFKSVFDHLCTSRIDFRLKELILVFFHFCIQPIFFCLSLSVQSIEMVELIIEGLTILCYYIASDIKSWVTPYLFEVWMYIISSPPLSYFPEIGSYSAFYFLFHAIAKESGFLF